MREPLARLSLAARLGLLAWLSGCCHDHRPAAYATELQACVAASQTEAESDACACEVAARYGRTLRGVQCP
jgi:lauroyl/myristoyl acyltransferase